MPFSTQNGGQGQSAHLLYGSVARGVRHACPQHGLEQVSAEALTVREVSQASQLVTCSLGQLVLLLHTTQVKITSQDQFTHSTLPMLHTYCCTACSYATERIQIYIQ